MAEQSVSVDDKQPDGMIPSTATDAAAAPKTGMHKPDHSKVIISHQISKP
jgi:hypothetical protein